uniref:AIG1-type G domain-containing protein n=1 Tax=Oreochromis aureus TaxID=47969 RepID=A0AAZ1XRC0_OREAU
MTVGEKNPNKINRTILLVGETGAGKSTLINALVNYTMGVKWEDGVWFQIVEEEKKSQIGGQTESQTSDVIVYEIFGFEDKTLRYSLTIINSPGYGDTRASDYDDTISYRLLDLFQSDDGVHEVHAVGLVMKVSDNRLSERLRYVFDSVMSLFGKDVEKNIIALITHSDGSRPENPLQALEAANIKCAKNEKNQPVYFLFDNCQHEEQMEENTNFRNSWELTQTNMDHLTDLLGKSNPQKLVKTAEVLNERIRLKACIQNLKERIELVELKQREIRQIREALKQTNHRSKMEIEKLLSLLENLEKEMKVLTAEKEKWLSDSYHHAVRLEEIALKADSASTIVHLDFLIEMMKEKGDTDKVQKLEEMRREDGGTKEAQRYKLGQTPSASKNIGRPSLWYK